jgi:Tol biopolymer transport system component
VRFVSTLMICASVATALFAISCEGPTSPSLSATRPILFSGHVEIPEESRSSPGRRPAIYAVQGDGSGLRLLTIGEGYAHEPVWSRDAAKIAFASGVSVGLNIWVMDADGSNAHRASDSFPDCGYNYRSVTWAPDGSRLAAECFWDVRIFDLTTGSTRSLSRLLDDYILDPDWSPDGTRLLIGDPFEPRVWSVRPDGNERSLVLSDASDAAWSPDGSHVAFVVTTDQRSAIWVARSDGSERRRVTAPDTVSYEAPTWSPDGRFLAFHRRTYRCYVRDRQPYCEPHWSIFVAKTDGTMLRRVTPDSLQATRPAW